MKFIKKLQVGPDFFAPTYLSHHTSNFRRMSATSNRIDNTLYYSWQFKSPKIPSGCAMIPPMSAEHILLFSLEKTEKIDSVAYRVNLYLQVNQVTIDQLIAGQSLYVTIDNWGK